MLFELKRSIINTMFGCTNVAELMKSKTGVKLRSNGTHWNCHVPTVNRSDKEPRALNQLHRRHQVQFPEKRANKWLEDLENSSAWKTIPAAIRNTSVWQLWKSGSNRHKCYTNWEFWNTTRPLSHRLLAAHP